MTGAGWDEGEAGQACGRVTVKSKGRVLSTLIHTVLFFTASAGFLVSLAILGEDRPWALDLSATEAMLGMGPTEGGGSGQRLDEWINGIGGKDGDRFRLLITMLYTCCAWSCCMVCTCVLGVTFLAPRNRPMVFVMQAILCVGMTLYGRFYSVFYQGSRHRVTFGSLLVLNWAALGLHIIDVYLNKRRKARADREKEKNK